MRQGLLEYVIGRASEERAVAPDTAAEALERVRRLRSYVEARAKRGGSKHERDRARKVLNHVWPVVALPTNHDEEITRLRLAACNAIVDHPCPYCGQHGLAHLGTCRFSQMNGGDDRLAAIGANVRNVGVRP